MDIESFLAPANIPSLEQIETRLTECLVKVDSIPELSLAKIFLDDRMATCEDVEQNKILWLVRFLVQQKYLQLVENQTPAPEPKKPSFGFEF